jgi:hypothetical protein
MAGNARPRLLPARRGRLAQRHAAILADPALSVHRGQINNEFHGSRKEIPPALSTAASSIRRDDLQPRPERW